MLTHQAFCVPERFLLLLRIGLYQFSKDRKWRRVFHTKIQSSTALRVEVLGYWQQLSSFPPNFCSVTQPYLNYKSSVLSTVKQTTHNHAHTDTHKQTVATDDVLLCACANRPPFLSLGSKLWRQSQTKSYRNHGNLGVTESQTKRSLLQCM